jgi:hypothetical protein
LPASRVAGKVAQKLSFAHLVDGIDQLPGEIFPVDRPLGNRFKADPTLPEWVDPVPGIELIEPSESILIPAEDDLELARLGIFSHAEKLGSPLGVVAGDRLVDVLADDKVALPLGVGEEFGSLGRDRLVLFG